MVHDWRAKWNGGSSVSIPGRPSGPRPFAFVQLAPYLSSGVDNVALVRSAQAAALALPNVAMASAVDWGDMESPNGPIHPRWKAPVGQRLALGISALAYGARAAYAGPSIVSAIAVPRAVSAATSAVSAGAGAQAYAQGVIQGGFDVNVTFDMAVTLVPPVETTPPMAGLVPAAAATGCEPSALGHGSAQCASFAVDGCNTTSVTTANGLAVSNSLLVHVGGSVSGGSAVAAAPTTVSYLQANWPVALVWSHEGGLPASPFAPFQVAPPAATME
jgi:hypothetical protein